MTQTEGQQRVRGALITGAAQRLGAVLAESLAAGAAEGAQAGETNFSLVLHSHKSGAECQALAESLTQKYKVKTTCLSADLSNPQAAEQLFNETLQALGGVPSVVISNAALFLPDPQPDTEKSAAEYESHARSHWAVNYESAVALTRCYAEACKGLGRSPEVLLPLMIHMGDATLTQARTAGLGAYANSKEALMQQMAPLALDCAPALRVVALAPGPCLRGVRQSQAHFEGLVQARPAQRATDPQEVAAVVGFLCRTPSLTGEVLYLDGGGKAASRVAAQDLNYGVEILSLAVPCRIGWTAAERAQTQTLEVSLSAQAALDDLALRSESLEQVINYSALEALVREAVENTQAHLLERLAAELLDAVFAAEPRLMAATITLAKPEIRSDCASLGIVLTRSNGTCHLF